MKIKNIQNGIRLENETGFIEVTIVNEKWITVHPNGKENKGRHLLIKDGETIGQAIERKFSGKQAEMFGKDTNLGKTDYKKSEPKDVWDRIDELKQSEKEKEDDKNRTQAYKDWQEEKKREDEKKRVEHEKEIEYNQNKEYKPLDIVKFGEGRFGLLADGVGSGAMEDANGLRWALFGSEDGAKKAKEEAEAAKKTEEKAETEEQKPEEKKEGLSAYEVSKVKGGMYASAKETTIYRSGMLTARVEEFGEGNYRVDFYDGKKLQKINTYSTKSGMEKAVSKHLEGTEEKQLEKTNLEEKRKVYQEVLKRYNENDEKRWHSSGEDYYKAYEDAEKAKKELTKARREYAESIMANFEEVEENPYEERQQARKERYEELSEKAQQRSDEISQSATRKFEAIPFGQPIHGASDRNYREKAWAQFGRSVEEGKKADYYAQKAESVGKAGISADDANAIAKLAQKYKSVSDSAERRRIIDRVIDIDKRTRAIKQAQDSGSAEDYSDLGFDVERNTGINRLQLKFSGIPSGEIRTKLKSYGFRWSPRESAWQRQLTGNAEYSFKRLVEELRKK